MINILKELKIGGADIADDDVDESRLLSFIEEIYNNCKRLEISPAFIVSWIKDLIDCRSLIDINKKEAFEAENDDVIEQLTTTIPTQKQQQVKNLKEFEGSINNPNLNDNEKTNSFIETLTSDRVPFVSQVSFFISQKKKEIDKFNNHQKAIEKNLRYLKEQENKTIRNLDTIIQKEKFALSYTKWFSNLEQSLQQNYNIDIKEDIQSFCQLVNDFKEKGYDANAIIQEYLKSLSVKNELKTNEDKIQSLQIQISQLTEQVSYLEFKINQHKVTLDIYSHLEAMGFGLKELRQLWDNILEISEANKISHRDAVFKFFKDIQEQYDNILGFKTKVNEKRGELALMTRELNNNRQNLFLNPLVGPSLSNLLQKGIGEQDIININQLVENIVTIDLIDKSNNGKPESKSEYWKTLVEELKKYDNIKLAIKEQQENLDKLQKQVNHLDKQKQEILNYLQIAISIINTINNQIYYYKGFIDHFKDINHHKFNVSNRPSVPFIFIVNKDIKKDKDDDDYDNK